MVEILIAAALVWCAVSVICFVAFLGVYLHFEVTQGRRRKAAQPAALAGEAATPAP